MRLSEFEPVAGKIAAKVDEIKHGEPSR